MSALTYSANPSQRYVLLDFETTGLDTTQDKIIEIGAIKMQGFEVVGRYQSFVNPERSIPKMIQELTGITDAMVADAPTIETLAAALTEFLEDLPIVAHNSSVEQGFLDHAVSPLVSGVAFTVHNSIEPMALILPDSPSHSMESLRKWAGVDSLNAHRADKDCEDLAKILRHTHLWMHNERPWLGALVEKLLPNWWWSWYFEAALNSLEQKPSLIQLLERESLGDLKALQKKDNEDDEPQKIEIDSKQVDEKLDYNSLDPRPSQHKMAQQVRENLMSGGAIAVEAPTGTGKSLAYLIPGVLAAEKSKTSLVISTHSKALQDQLLEKDIPLVSKIFDREIKATSVKGQENYVCLRKLFAETEFLPEPDSEAGIQERFGLAYVFAFTKTQRLAELDRTSAYLKNNIQGLPALIDRVKSHHMTTKGPICPFYQSCHFFGSARLAHQSEVLIANHALTFHWPEHLPKLRNVIFDEAHHLEDQLTEAHTVNLTEIDFSEVLDRLTAKGKSRKSNEGNKINRLLSGLTLPKGPAGEEHFEDYLNNLRTRIRELSSLVPGAIARKKGRDTGGYEDFINLAQYERDPVWVGLENLRDSSVSFLNYLLAGQKAVSSGPFKGDPANDVLQTYVARMTEFSDALKAATTASTVEGSQAFLRLLFWNPRETVWRIRVSPIEVKDLGKEFFSELKSTTLTSATLSGGANQTFVTNRIGIELTKPFMQLPSPYPLEKQAVAFIPSDVAPPGTPAHSDAVIQFTENVAKILQGRTLLLMSANFRLKAAAETLRERLEPLGIRVFDSLTDRRAIDSFRQCEKAVLVGGERYGEGVDLPGKQLACVVIEKINEAMTRGPLAEARKARTKFGLFDYDFPLRMMWLKQRVGRLIRTPHDKGAVVIFDPRYHAWSAPSQSHVHTTLAPIPVIGGTRDSILMKIESMGI